MTTIVCKDGTMAADGRVCMGDILDTDNAKKLYRLSNGAIVGFCGSIAGMFQARQDFDNNPEPKNRPYRGTEMLYLHPDGSLEWYAKGTWYPVPNGEFAMGSGMEFARGAMGAGATAVEAVRIAKQNDIRTGGRIRSMSI